MVQGRQTDKRTRAQLLHLRPSANTDSVKGANLRQLTVLIETMRLISVSRFFHHAVSSFLAEGPVSCLS
jgi:hypothetical protein